ncbi:hypothetical protein EYZ11_012520 [Aspergillus tanneri]|uniref:Uncharacterized protein n=1 Tax=Aspergillus tanneri TaxID=1220188 RepID=A0A4S3J023_9EURO|nr:hypothetical protein EYZ11_012520 [Aspergillus tanneri]
MVVPARGCNQTNQTILKENTAVSSMHAVTVLDAKQLGPAAWLPGGKVVDKEQPFKENIYLVDVILGRGSLPQYLALSLVDI